MRRDELEELCYITPIENVPSICHLGILSHNRVKELGLRPASVAAQEIQDRRAKKRVPGGRPLHDYANLYICARNPMLFKRLDQHITICILRVSPAILDRPDVVISDANASADEVYVRFARAPEGLEIVDGELTFAEFWTDPNWSLYLHKKSKKCAEVLVPDCVPPRFLTGAYVSCAEPLTAFGGLGVGIIASIDRHLFFNRGAP